MKIKIEVIKTFMRMSWENFPIFIDTGIYLEYNKSSGVSIILNEKEVQKMIAAKQVNLRANLKNYLDKMPLIGRWSLLHEKMTEM